MKLRAFDVCFRAVQRGYSADEIRPCFQKTLGGGWFDVDVRHAAYPATAKEGYSPPRDLRAAAFAMADSIGVVVDQVSSPLPATASSPTSGPGTELHALLRDWLGIEPTPECRCRSMAKKMDARGPEWCEGDGMAEILDVMRAEHTQRWSSGKTILPWTDAGARQLVLLACRRSRSKAAG